MIRLGAIEASVLELIYRQKFAPLDKLKKSQPLQAFSGQF